MQTRLDAALAPCRLLDHPWYRAWETGRISRESLREYAGQYFHHVSAFPRYVSATHSQVESLATRQELLANLVDEESGPENHPELWLRFAEGLGARREDVRAGTPSPATRALVETFLRCARSSAAEGLGALYAYESQVPRIAEFKLEALRKFYFNECAFDARPALEFFEVHRIADVHHTEALLRAIAALPAPDQERATAACAEAARALWAFLDSMGPVDCDTHFDSMAPGAAPAEHPRALPA